MWSSPMSRCSRQCRCRSSAAVARSCSRLTLPLQYPSVARFSSRAAPRGGKPRFEAIIIVARNLRAGPLIAKVVDFRDGLPRWTDSGVWWCRWVGWVWRGVPAARRWPVPSLGRRRTLQPGRGLCRCAPPSDFCLHIRRQRQELVRRLSGAQPRADQSDVLRRGHAHRREGGGRGAERVGEDGLVGGVATWESVGDRPPRRAPLLLHAEEREWEGEEREDHSVSTLLRRPKPSSTAGAPGSGTHRWPSTTNAYWCWPAGSVSVAVHTPVGPERTSGVARASHWLNVPARLTAWASGATSTKRTVTVDAGMTCLTGSSQTTRAAARASAGARSHGRMRRRRSRRAITRHVTSGTATGVRSTSPNRRSASSPCTRSSAGSSADVMSPSSSCFTRGWYSCSLMCGLSTPRAICHMPDASAS